RESSLRTKGPLSPFQQRATRPAHEDPQGTRFLGGSPCRARLGRVSLRKANRRGPLSPRRTERDPSIDESGAGSRSSPHGEATWRARSRSRRRRGGRGPAAHRKGFTSAKQAIAASI